MKKSEFVAEFAEMLSMEAAELRDETPLASLAAWDSVAYLSAMVLIDSRLELTIRPELLSQARTFGDIVSAVSAKLVD